MSLKNQNKMVQSKNYIGSIPRTLLTRNLETRATFSAGELFPIYCEEIYPAMSKKVTQGSFIRSITPLGPTMDKAFMDVFYFFVPFRLIWDHWEEFIAGFNKEAWTQGVEYTTPQIKFKVPTTGTPTDNNAYIGSFCDHVPGLCDVVSLAQSGDGLYALITSADPDLAITSEEAEKRLNALFGFSALYPRAYAKVWNDWFRDENYQDELEIYTGDNDEYADEFCFNLLGDLPKANQYHNRFTSALPFPVKGPDVLIPMDNLQISGDLPVGVVASANASNNTVFYTGFSSGTFTKDKFRQEEITNSGSGVSGDKVIARAGDGVVGKNVSNTIRMLRLATQTELLLARDARGGTRYVESLLSHWSTHNGDARLQRSEYLGSRQIPLSVFQITNTAQSSDGALGNVGGQSVTKDAGLFFAKSFSEYGVVIGLACVRTNLSYGSGRRKQFTRKGRFEYIWPEFRHVGDVELKTTELDQGGDLILGESDIADTVLGYTPYGSELREGYNANTGLFRARADGSLSYLTYQLSYDYNEHPVISDEFLQQPSEVVANTLVSQSGPQFYAVFQFIEESVVPLDPTSDPGLMDHF